MAHDVFISYASQNRTAADAVCAALEGAKIRCWIAPRDASPGELWAGSIVDAITDCRVMVLVFTAEANSSREVLKEVSLASDKPIVPFRIVDLQPSGSMRYHLAAVHWLDALPPPMEDHFGKLVASVARFLGRTVGPQPGDVKVNPVDGQRYLWIPPGEFEMGGSPGDMDAEVNESPRHRVSISRGFWMGETPVTVDAYRRFVQAAGRSMPEEPVSYGKPLNPGWKFGQVPMTMVTWDDAVAYANWAGLRLPTEAEWEYAARAGTTGPRYGDLDRIGWIVDNSGDRSINSAKIWAEDRGQYWKRILEYGCRPRDVRGKEPNPWGLYDTIGNVWECTADSYDANYYARSPSKDPQGALSGKSRLARGGSWLNDPSDARVSCRATSDPADRGNAIGFRCAGE